MLNWQEVASSMKKSGGEYQMCTDKGYDLKETNGWVGNYSRRGLSLGEEQEIDLAQCFLSKRRKYKIKEGYLISIREGFGVKSSLKSTKSLYRLSRGQGVPAAWASSLGGNAGVVYSICKELGISSWRGVFGAAPSIGSLRNLWYYVGCRPSVLKDALVFIKERVAEAESNRMSPFIQENSYWRGIHLSELWYCLPRTKNGIVKPRNTQEAFDMLKGVWCAGTGHKPQFLRRIGRAAPALRWSMLTTNEEYKPLSSKWWERVSQRMAIYQGQEYRYSEQESRFQWKSAFGRIPKSKEVADLGEYAGLLKESKGFKVFNKNLTEDILSSEHSLLAWIKICSLWGPNALQWVGESSIHERGINLPPTLPDVWKKWLWNLRKDLRWADALRIAGMHEQLEGRGLTTKLGLAQLLKEVIEVPYKTAQSLPFALECSKWLVPEVDYSLMESRWIEGTNVDKESIPFIYMDKGEYRFSTLSRKDPRGLFLGQHTGCCQHPYNVGKTCAWHGSTNSDGSFVVVEKFGLIIAQSWVWRNGNSLCFDNIESKGSISTSLLELYKEASKLFLNRLGIKRVLVGGGYTSLPLDGLVKVESVDTPKKCYTDAYTQYLLAGCHES